MLANEFSDDVRLMEPLLVRGALVLDHGGESIEFIRGPARERIPAHEMDTPQKWCEPWFHNHDAAIGAENTTHFRKRLGEIVRQGKQVMQAALHDQNIAAAVWKWEFAAIGGNDFGGSGKFSKQARRKVDAFNAREP
jgi:hypothetical protein